MGFDLKKASRWLLDQPVKEKPQLEKMAEYKLPKALRCRGMLLVIQLYEAALGGNLTAMKELRNLLEEEGSAGEEVVIVDDVPAK